MCDCTDCEEERIIKMNKMRDCNCRRCERINRCFEKRKEKKYYECKYNDYLLENRKNQCIKDKEKNEKIIIITIN
jgi:hypothetical protein